MSLPPQFLAPPPSLAFFFFSGAGSSPWEEGLEFCHGWDLNPRTPFGNGRAETPAGIERGTWKRPEAIVCGRRDRYGAPLGSNITSKVALAKGGLDEGEARVAQGGRLRMEDPIVGELGRPIGGHPPWAHPGPWVTGSRRWRGPGRMGRAAGFDRTSAAPPQQPGVDET